MKTIESKPFVPEAQRSTLVKQMMGTCKCDEKTAKHYLSEEGWKLPEAISSYKEDKAQGIHAKEKQMIKINAAIRLKVMAKGGPVDDHRDYDAEYDEKAAWKADATAEGLTFKKDHSDPKNLLAYRGKTLKGKWVDDEGYGWLNE